MSIELWKQFSLGEENNFDPGGGIMYALKYPLQVIEQKSLQIAAILDGIDGLTITEDGESLLVDATGVDKNSYQKISALIEEQSVLTAAGEYRKFFEEIGISSIAGLRDYVVGLIVSLNNHNKADLYNHVDMGIRSIIGEIMNADKQNKVLTTKQRKELQELQDACDRFIRIAGNRTIIIG